MEQLRTWRVRRYLSQTELAKQAGIEVTTVQKLEAGRARPRPATLGRLCRALAVPPEELLTPDELAAVGTRPARGKAAPTIAPPEPTPALRCAFDGQPLDPAGDCWHLVGEDPQAAPRGAHWACWQQRQPRPQVAPCCRRGGACGQHWS